MKQRAAGEGSKSPMNPEYLNREIARLTAAAESDRRIAPPAMATEARRHMWRFTPFRTKMRAEFDKLKDPLAPERLERIDFLGAGTHLIDLMDKMVEIVVNARNPTLYAYFARTCEKVRAMLDDSYFSKGPEQIIDQYNDAVLDLTACAYSCDLRVMHLDVAINHYAKRILEELDGGAAGLKTVTDENNDMATAAKSSSAPNPTSSAGSTQRPKGDSWFTVMILLDRYSSSVSDEDRSDFSDTKKRVGKSDLPAPEKRALLEYMKPAEEGKGGRFAFVKVVDVVKDYLDKKITSERFAFECRLMKAWCEGSILQFFAQERRAIAAMGIPDADMEKIENIISLSVDKRDILQILAAANLRVFYPIQSPEKRAEALDRIIRVLESANPV